METKVIDLLKAELNEIRSTEKISNLVYKKGSSLFMNGQSQMLTQSKQLFEFSVDDEFDDYKISISINGTIEMKCNCKSKDLCHHKIASLMQLHEELSRSNFEPKTVGKEYTREGMKIRVMAEREEKAKKAEYKIEQSDNIYGEHILYNEKGVEYKLTFYNFNQEHGYCSCPDYATNKLGTCKHLMYAFKYLKTQKRTPEYYQHPYPFVEIFLHPLKDYKISWFYPGEPDEQIKQLITKYFGNENTLSNDKVLDFLGFMNESQEHKQIMIRPGVQEVVEKAYDKEMLSEIKEHTTLNLSTLKLELFPYQKEGIEFATFRESAIIADEMGLGKTIQAIGTAIAKKEIFGFERTLIVCPASIKEQWKNEIERFTDEKATVIEGYPYEREKIYENCENYFLIINYETVLRDKNVINKHNTDFIILDEAQRIKNYDTQTSNSIKSLKKKHSLIITGTPIENRLIDLYSIVAFLDPGFLSPLWEFSYQHCFFDIKKKDKITGYYNLQELKERLSSILIRREKKDVIKQLPNISHLDIPVEMHPEQRQFHASYSQGVAKILHKKFITPFDMQRLMMFLSKMRMVCDSTYLVDFETNYSPKMIELKYILLEKLDIKNNNKKIIIFSEWKRMNNIIAKMLRENDIGFVELNGSIPVKKRGNLIKEFEENESYRVFISTEAGGSGLNLQVADTVINFELPWNPAKKNQRIGRIDRIGQKNQNLTVISFITKNSIETKIAGGLVLKQNLFDGVLSPDSTTEIVDFSEKGRSQFLKQLEEAIDSMEEEAITIESDTGLKVDSDIQTDEPLIVDPAIEEKKEEKIAENKVSATEPKNLEEKEKTSMELEQVMNQGMGFLSGLFKMATGKDMGMDEQSITVDKETGEVTMKFKLPV
ncbi:MAG: DEAD/DEAH box helicase [Bacteroidota bacterium]